MKKLSAISMIAFMLLSILAVGVSAVDPVFDSVPDQTMNEGTTRDILLSATDADGDALTYSISPPAPAWVTLSGATLRLAPDFTVTGSSASMFTITVSVSDGTGSDTESFDVTVNPATPTSDLLVVSDVTLGSERQVRSNPDADDESDQDVFTTGTFTIRNAGPNPLAGITATPAVVLGSEADYGLSLSGVPTSLAAGASATVSVRARVPETLDAVDDDAQKVAPLVAQVTVAGTMAGTALSVVSDVTMEAENQLEIKKLKVCVNGSCDTLRDGDKVEDLKPGDVVDVTIAVENKYKDNDAEDIVVEEVNAFILVEETDFDVDEDDEIGDIGADEEEETTLSFDVEDDAEDGTVTMKAWVEGEDENGARHGELFEIELEVKRERHEVSLRNVLLEPETLSCGAAGADSTVVLSLELHNTGRDDEDEVAVEVENSDLGISKVERDLQIDQDDRERKSYTLRVPSDARPGVYALSVKSFTRRDDLSDSEDVLLTVPTCAPVEPETPESEEPADEETGEEVVVVTGPSPEETPALPTPTGAVAAPVTSSSGKASSNGMYIALLVAIIVVLVIIGVMLVNALAKRN